MEITTIGIDLAKHVFQVHGVDADGGVAVRRKLRRSEVIGFFSKLAPTSGRHGSLRDLSLLGAGAWRHRPHGAPHPAGLCEAVREAPEERRRRYGGDLRGRFSAIDALRAIEERRAAGRTRAAQDTRSSHPAADDAGQRAPSALGRVRHHREAGCAGLETLIRQIGTDAVSGVPAVAHEGLLLLAGQSATPRAE